MRLPKSKLGLVLALPLLFLSAYAIYFFSTSPCEDGSCFLVLGSSGWPWIGFILSSDFGYWLTRNFVLGYYAAVGLATILNLVIAYFLGKKIESELQKRGVVPGNATLLTVLIVILAITFVLARDFFTQVSGPFMTFF